MSAHYYISTPVAQLPSMTSNAGPEASQKPTASELLDEAVDCIRSAGRYLRPVNANERRRLREEIEAARDALTRALEEE